MKKQNIELLAPAGSLEAYKAAVNAGADAVYLGGKAFNARHQANNFDNQTLKEVITDARIRGVKTYIVLNTLVSDKELKEAAELASFVYNEGVDGVIVQDLGIVKILKEVAPALPIHASTQMTIHNADGVKAAQNLGISRVVLARELSLHEIEGIVRDTGIEAEVFIHGALCISRSGQCLLSSFIGGRSGNRGRCAQPCRLPYSIERTNGEQTYLLSPKDIMTLELLPDILNAGVSSLKIEGRMKSAEYVAATVMLYRKYINLALSNPSEYAVNSDDVRMLLQVFNRGGFSTGYLNRKEIKSIVSAEHPKHWGVRAGTVVAHEKDYEPKFFGSRENKLIRIKLSEQVEMGDGLEIWDKNTPSAIISVMMKNGKHVKDAKPGDTVLLGNFKSYAVPGSAVYKTYDKKLVDNLSELAKGTTPTVPVRGEFCLSIGQKPLLIISDYSGHSVKYEGEDLCQVARGKPITSERISEQLKKTGDTPYYFDSINALVDDNAFIAISVINEMRREALNQLSEERAKTPIRQDMAKKTIRFPGNAQKLSHERKISLMFSKTPPEEVWDSLAVDRVYLRFEDYYLTKEIQSRGIEAYAAVPAVLTDKQMDTFVKKIASLDNPPDGLLVGNLGALNRMRNEFRDIPVIIDFQMNIFNSSAVEVLREYKPSGIIPSIELNFDALAELNSQGIPLEACVYGLIPVMTLEYCPGSNINICTGRCRECTYKQGYLTDRLGKNFLYRTNPILNRTMLYNSKTLMIDDLAPFESTHVKTLRIDIMDETPDEINEICKFYRQLWVNRNADYTFQCDSLLTKLKEKGLTKGHYYRGVD
jgi:putative protease